MTSLSVLPCDDLEAVRQEVELDAEEEVEGELEPEEEEEPEELEEDEVVEEVEVEVLPGESFEEDEEGGVSSRIGCRSFQCTRLPRTD